MDPHDFPGTVVSLSDGTPRERVSLAITAWLHAKHHRSMSAKTHATYATTLQAFRARLQADGYDLDAAEPHPHRPSDAGAAGARAAALALAAQSFATQPVTTRYGLRPVASTTANLRLAVVSSFYDFAVRQGLFTGPNPIARVERQVVQSYAGAHALPYETLRERLDAIDLATPAGLRDYALLLIGLHTGRRLSELAAMRWGHLTVRAGSLEILWPRCKGGKLMRDELPLHTDAGLAARALLAWMEHLASTETVTQTRALSTLHHEAPLWVSLARNGSAGHPLSLTALADICEKRLGTRKVHTLRHTFARALEDAGAKVSEIQARLGHASLDTTGRYLAQLHASENPHLARLSQVYGIGVKRHQE